MTSLISKLVKGAFAALERAQRRLVRREEGNALMIAMIMAGTAAAVIAGSNQLLQHESKIVAMGKNSDVGNIIMTSSTTIFEKLLHPVPGGLPAVYPDPYFGATTLNPITRSSGTDWSIQSHVVTTALPNVAVATPLQLSNTYALGQPPLFNPQKDPQTHLTMVEIDPPNNPATPYLIPSIIVRTNTSVRSNIAGMPAKALESTVRVTLPPPPPPACRITASSGTAPVYVGSTITLSVYGVGVVVAGTLYDGFGGQTSLTSGGPTPSPANSVSSNVVIKQVPLTIIAPPDDTDIYNLTASVTGPQGATATCGLKLKVWSDPNLCAYKCTVGVIYACNPAPKPVHGFTYSNKPPQYVCYRCGVFTGYNSLKGCEEKVIGHRGSGGCFAADTMIRGGDGFDRPIRLLRRGDKVWDPVAGRAVIVREVIAGPELEPLFTIGYGGQTVEVTKGHPFLGRFGLISAASLKLGDEIQTGPGKWQRIEVAVKNQALPHDEVWNVVASAADGSQAHTLLANGIVTGDLELQRELAKREHP